MKNTIFKRRLFFGAILLFSCENDDVSQKEPSTQIQPDFVVKKLNFKELKNNTKAFEKLQEAEAKSTTHLGRGLFDENFGVFVDTTNIVMIQEGNNHSFTFRIINDNSENEIKNLVLSSSTGLTYRAYVATYASTAEEVNNILTNEMLTEIAPTSIVELGLSSRNGIGGDGADCIDFFTITQMYCRNAAGNTIVDSGSDLGNDCVGMSWPEEFVILRLDHDCMSDSGGNFGTTNPGGQYGPPLNPGNTGGGGSNPSSSDPLLTTPLLPFAIKDFVITLSPEKRLAYNSLSVETKQDFLNFFQLDRSYEAFEYAESLLDYLILNNYSPEAEEEICNILDLLDDGKINGEAVLVGPDVTITNMTQYLSIFNTSLPAEITISADQPVSGSHFPVSSTERAGHAIITIKQGTKVRSLGFYPKSTPASLVPNTLTLNPTDFISVPSSFGNDENHDFDASLSMPVIASQLLNTINNIKALFQSNVLYNLKTSNCADFAITIFNSINTPVIPSCETPYLFWSGSNTSNFRRSY
ncbi:hypothetical protein [Flavobacterium sp.]|jgi:hypothetical protein|uniref:hypothetical protein n=1 Tax=Flavobacterium sp. TaxID=239 RepID=UPI0037C12762